MFYVSNIFLLKCYLINFNFSPCLDYNWACLFSYYRLVTLNFALFSFKFYNNNVIW